MKSSIKDGLDLFSKLFFIDLSDMVSPFIPPIRTHFKNFALSNKEENTIGLAFGPFWGSEFDF